MTCDFYDEIPLMVTRACRIRGITQAELGKRLGYSPDMMSRIAKGHSIDGMPLGKLMLLMEEAECGYEWRRY